MQQFSQRYTVYFLHLSALQISPSNSCFSQNCIALLALYESPCMAWLSWHCIAFPALHSYVCTARLSQHCSVLLVLRGSLNTTWLCPHCMILPELHGFFSSALQLFQHYTVLLTLHGSSGTLRLSLCCVALPTLQLYSLAALLSSELPQGSDQWQQAMFLLSVMGKKSGKMFTLSKVELLQWIQFVGVCPGTQRQPMKISIEWNFNITHILVKGGGHGQLLHCYLETLLC